MNPKIERIRRELWQNMVQQIEDSPFIQQLLGVTVNTTNALLDNAALSATPPICFKRRLHLVRCVGCYAAKLARGSVGSPVPMCKCGRVMVVPKAFHVQP